MESVVTKGVIGMPDFAFEKLNLNDTYLISNFYAADQRGDFRKIFEKEIFRKMGIDFSLSESNASISVKNVVRGMHFQLGNPQAKLVSVLHGAIWDCIVDLRKNSNTYKQWLGVRLSADNHKALYVPKGFAHGFAALEDDTVIFYHCDGVYDKKTDTGILIDDKDLNIEWPIDLHKAIRSERDLHLMSLKEYEEIVNSESI